MFKKTIVIVLLPLIVFTPCLLCAQNKLNEKKLLEYGWDKPSVSALKVNFIEREKTPFDGVFFSLDFDVYAAFDPTLFADSRFQYSDLQKIQWGKFTDNFLMVSGFGHSGAWWLDDAKWANISQNIKKVSKALSISKAMGIGFDPEYYLKDTTLDPWKYRPSWYKNLSYQEVGKYVKKRGKQFIQALQTYKPDVKIFCVWLLGAVYSQRQNHPIEETGMALYPFFVEGMLEGKNNSSEIIDGNEAAYTYQNFVPFVKVGPAIRGMQSELINKSLRSKFKNISIAQPVYLDYLYAKWPKYEKGFNKQTKESWLKDNLYFAFKTTDKYVWFYDEKKINWWKNEVDSGLTEIINGVRDKINSESQNNLSKVSGSSLALDFKNKESNNYSGFSYTYQKNNNLLEIKLLKNDIKTLEVYKNSFLIFTVDNPAMNFIINLNKKYNRKGNLIIMAKDSKGVYSASFVN